VLFHSLGPTAPAVWLLEPASLLRSAPDAVHTSWTQACVNYIRQKGLGIATFVILKQQQERWTHKMAAITTPQGGCCSLITCQTLMPLCIAYSAMLVASAMPIPVRLITLCLHAVPGVIVTCPVALCRRAAAV
jgi:hypothetical protein